MSDRKWTIACATSVEDCGNPYLRLLYDGDMTSKKPSSTDFRLLKSMRVKPSWIWKHRSRFDILHLHWPSFLYDRGSSFFSAVQFARVAVALLLAKLLGKKIIWTAHNVMPHDGSKVRLHRIARKVIIRLSDLILVHSQYAKEQLVRRFRLRCPVVEVPHMMYSDVHRDSRSIDFRAELGLQDDTLLLVHFGEVRENKNIETVLEQFRKVDRKDIALLIYGWVADRRLEDALTRKARKDPRVITRFERVPDDEVVPLMLAADLGIVASEITTSGTIYLFLTHNVPVLVSQHMARTEPDCHQGIFTFNGEASDGIAESLAELCRLELNAARESIYELRAVRSAESVSQKFYSAVSRNLC